MIARLWRWLVGPETDDGFGQSLFDDLRYLRRFRACRAQPIAWRQPTAQQARRWEAHPIVGRFGDLLAVATLDGRDWILRQRLWHGWPDPPEFAWFVLEGDAIWAAADVDRWPAAWTKPADPVA